MLTEMDIEDISDVNCPKTGTKCTQTCLARPAEQPLKIVFADGRQWFRVMDVRSILDTFAKIQNAPYMLVGGNTAQGQCEIYVK